MGYFRYWKDKNPANLYFCILWSFCHKGRRNESFSRSQIELPCKKCQNNLREEKLYRLDLYLHRESMNIREEAGEKKGCGFNFYFLHILQCLCCSGSLHRQWAFSGLMNIEDSGENRIFKRIIINMSRGQKIEPQENKPIESQLKKRR